MTPRLIGRLTETLGTLVNLGPTVTELGAELGRTREAIEDMAGRMDRLAGLMEQTLARIDSTERVIRDAGTAVEQTSDAMEAEGRRLREESEAVREELGRALADVRSANEAALALVDAADSVPLVDTESDSR
ncbi:MAG: hypothetical protein R3343_06735 [Nitriliruptorales bacterium]|nr:hypothetical protein [Nitriliruptorales bacterium]